MKDIYVKQYGKLVIKRDGIRTEPYDQGKIEATLKSLLRTSNEVTEDLEKLVIVIANTVTMDIAKSYPIEEKSPVSTEVIQEHLERTLMHFGLYKTLRMCIILGYTKLLINNPPK